MSTTEVAKQHVQSAAVAAETGQPTVFDLIRRQQAAIEMALPAHFNSERFTRIALTTVRQNRQLAQCDAASLLGALMVSAQLGLEPGGPLGHCYFVPFKREVTFILGYKGIIELARRSGQVSSINAHEVCEGDEFEYAYGTDSYLRHKPTLQERGKAYAYYAVVKFKDGGHEFVVLSLAEIDRHRKRSKSANNGPWVSDFDAMARKTCIRVLAPYLPLSPELERAIRGDERVYRTVEQDLADTPVVEPAGELPAADAETGEVVDTQHDDDDPGRPFEEPATNAKENAQ